MSANVTLNGKRLDGKVIQLRQGFLASEVKSYLDANKDGYDSYKISVGGRDFLVLGKGYRELKAADNLAIDGQRAQVDFLEQEANTAGEGVKKSLFSLGGLGKGLLGGVAGLAGGFGALTLFATGVSTAPLWAILGVPAAIGLSAGLLLTGGWGALKGAMSRTDDSVATALSSGPPGTFLPKGPGPVPPAVPGERPAPPKVDPDPEK
ncbi:MAG: hypothetical protein FJZ01_07775 [Candidatus Sericytochromatia bacterium]|nr:hypothetical protein [Candidatus Tanganyikabacteria bacterium]